jgi:hypothetical protein
MSVGGDKHMRMDWFSSLVSIAPILRPPVILEDPGDWVKSERSRFDTG